MSVDLTINGVTYPFPETGDTDWGPDVTDWATAVTGGMLQKAGGTFQLLAEVDFGTAYGIKSLYYKSRTANPASSGQIRLAQADVINWRNNANGANLSLGVSSDTLQFNGSNIATASDLASYVPKSLYSAKGAILAASGTSTPATLSVGTNGFVLTADSGEATGIKWAAAGAGDVLGPASSVNNGFARFDGTTGKLLKDGGTTLVNADIATNAAIAFSKMAALTASRALVSDGSGVVSAATTTATEIGYLNGVTSSIQTQLDAKQPTISVSDTNSIDSTLSSNTISSSLKISTGAASNGSYNALLTIESDGLMAQVPAYANALTNLSLAVTFGAGAMTIAVKTLAGNNPTSASPVIVPVRSNTASSGAFDLVAVTSALSITVPSGATLGLNSGGGFGSVYLSFINNAGTGELSVNSQWLQDGIISTSAIGTGSDTAGDYSTTSRSNVGSRMIARLDFNSAPNGTWASVDKVSIGNCGDLHSATSVVTLLTATSGTKTPGASNNYLAMSGNSLILQPGFWKLNGQIGFASSGGSAGYASFQALWSAANGGDNGTLPASLTTTTGLTVLSPYDSSGGFNSPSAYLTATLNAGTLQMPEVTVYADRTATVYLVPRAAMSTPANARVTCAAWAQLIS